MWSPFLWSCSCFSCLFSLFLFVCLFFQVQLLIVVILLSFYCTYYFLEVFSFFSFLSILYWLCYYNYPIFFSISSLSALHHTPNPPTVPALSSCPGVIHISSLASVYRILFLPSPCLFSTYHLCYLFSVPFPSLPSHSPVDNLPCDLHFCGSVPVLVVCLVCFFCFCFFRFGGW